MEYTEKVSFLMDLKIIFMTVKNVLKREGISPEGSATMDFFKGEE